MRFPGVILVRHGQADGSDDDDPPLSEFGRTQARALGPRLADLEVAAILHSPRRRARETARVAAAALRDVPVRASSPIDDRTPVPSPGRRSDYPERVLGRLAATPADEQDVDGVQIAAAAAELVRLARSGGPVVAITHAFVIGWIVAAALDAPPAAWLTLAPANAGITVLETTPGGLRLVSYNDTAHLRGL